MWNPFKLWDDFQKAQAARHAVQMDAEREMIRAWAQAAEEMKSVTTLLSELKLEKEIVHVVHRQVESFDPMASGLNPEILAIFQAIDHRMKKESGQILQNANDEWAVNYIAAALQPEHLAKFDGGKADLKLRSMILHGWNMWRVSNGIKDPDPIEGE